MALSYAQLAENALPHGLMLMGGCAPRSGDPVPMGTKTIVLLGPDAQFWDHFQTQPEFGQPDAVDHWSTRVIDDLAQQANGTALFPFAQQPPLPFISWALATGQTHVSRVNLLIHETAGLWVSYRGAIALPYLVDMPGPAASPCTTCATPRCLTACPAGALNESGYDVPMCHAYLDSREGQACMTGGCNVRAICPVSENFGREPEQSAHHMRYFHK